MNLSADIRVALLGYGLGGAAFHAPLIASTPGMQLATVVTRDPARRAQAQREHPAARLVDAAEEVWKRAGDYDLVVISTPNRTHAELALAALQAGLSVVVDKPFARTATEARTMIDRAQLQGRASVVWRERAERYRWAVVLDDGKTSVGWAESEDQAWELTKEALRRPYRGVRYRGPRCRW